MCRLVETEEHKDRDGARQPDDVEDGSHPEWRNGQVREQDDRSGQQVRKPAVGSEGLDADPPWNLTHWTPLLTCDSPTWLGRVRG